MSFERKAEHILPASTLASVITAILVNPLEVLKVRQQKGQRLSCQIHPQTISMPAVLLKQQQQSIKVVTCSSLSHPVTRLPRTLAFTHIAPKKVDHKTCHKKNSSLLQKALDKLPKFNFTKRTSCVCINQQNLFTGIRHIISTEGIKPLLFNGLRYSLYAATASTMIYFYLYEKVTSALHKAVTTNKIALPILSAAISRAFTTSLTFPLEYWRTLQHAQLTAGRTFAKQSSANRAPLGAAFAVTIQRDVLFSSLYWMLVENIRNITNDIVNRNNRNNSKSMNLFDEKTILSNDEIIVVDNLKNNQPINQKSTLSNIVAGSIAGATTALVTLPLDVIKTKRQLHDSFAKTSSFQTMQIILREEGIKGLYAGARPRVAKAIISCSSMLSLYEFFYGVCESIY